MTQAIDPRQTIALLEHSVLRGACSLALAVTLLGCGEPTSSMQGNDQLDSDSNTINEPVPIDPGLIVNQDFAYREGSETLERPWMSTQHAGAQSYQYEVSDGVLTLTRTGVEPWGQISQRVSVREHGGKRLKFSAWLKASLNDDFEPWSESTGIAATVFISTAGPMGAGGTRFAFTEESAIPIENGDYGWARHDVEFDLPDNAHRVDIRIRLTRGGWIKAQYPSLEILNNGTDSHPEMDDATG